MYRDQLIWRGKTEQEPPPPLIYMTAETFSFRNAVFKKAQNDG
jgi:hypothetical protein